MNEQDSFPESPFGTSDPARLHTTPRDTGCGLIFNLSTGSIFFWMQEKDM